MLHELKLNENFADAVYTGEKCFEVRYNDRGYQKGDAVRFSVVDEHGIPCLHSLDEKTFVITYVLSGWHIDPDYVVFGIKEIDDAAN